MGSFSNYQNQLPSSPPEPKKSFKKGVGFVPNSISSYTEDAIESLLRNAPKTAKGYYSLKEIGTHADESRTTIPLFDLESIYQSAGEERKRILHTYGLALVNEGFIGIKAQNLKPLVNTLYNEMSKYFRQPLEKKLLDWKKNQEQRGFSYRGFERGPKALLPDFKESFFITPNFREWPANFSSLSKATLEYHQVLTEVSKYLLQFLLEFLEQKTNMETEIARANNILRLAYYPAFKPGDDPTGVWNAAHKDSNLITILSRATIPGLQYYSSRGLWEPVVVPEGYLIVTTGLLLQHKTAGLIKARWHRVHNPGGKYTRYSRLSTAFYATWPDTFPLNPFENCINKMTIGMAPSRKDEYLDKYPPITVAEKNAHRSGTQLVTA